MPPLAQVAYVLLVGEKPNVQQYQQFRKEIQQHMFLVLVWL